MILGLGCLQIWKSECHRKVREIIHDRCPLVAADGVAEAILLAADDIMRMLLSRGTVGRLCNMHTERLLARYRKSCRPRSSVDRQIASGYLASVRHAHFAAGRF